MTNSFVLFSLLILWPCLEDVNYIRGYADPFQPCAPGLALTFLLGPTLLNALQTPRLYLKQIQRASETAQWVRAHAAKSHGLPGTQRTEGQTWHLHVAL